jgi:serine protease
VRHDQYYNAALDHYFITAFADEAADLDAGAPVPGWTRTGFTFRSWKSGTGPGNEACRFFGTPGVGPNSHFYTIDPAEFVAAIEEFCRRYGST